MKEFRVVSLILALFLSAPLWAQDEPMISLDFHEVDIQDVIKSISEITGKNFVIGDGVRGKVTIISPSPVTVDQAYEAFLSALSVKKLCASESGSVTKILPLRECSSAPTPFSFGEDDSPAGDEFVTKLISLKYVDANEIRQVLNSMVGRRETIVAHGPTNSLIISGSAANIARLQKLIQHLDNPGKGLTTEIIPLKHAQADVVAQKLLAIFQQDKVAASKSRRRSDDVEGGASVAKILADARTNSLIVKATRDGLERVLDLLAEMDREVEIAIDRNRIHVRPLHHAKAEDLAGILAALLSGQSSGGGSSSGKPGAPSSKKGDAKMSTQAGTLVKSSGSMFEQEVRVVADPSTNSLVITASPNDYASIEPIIDQLDSRRAQVFVETLIMEVNVSKMVEAGVSFHGGTGVGQDGSVMGGTNFGSKGSFSSAAISQNPAALAGLPGAIMSASSGSPINLGNGVSIPALGAVLKAQQTSGVYNVLSAPNILTVDNKKAEIQVGQEVPYKTGEQMNETGGSTTQYTRENVGIILSVLPHIGGGDAVTLEIQQEISGLEEDKMGAGDVITKKRKATTTVLANSEQTIVLGGLITDKVDRSTKKVPLLGDIPLLGYLFREESKTTEKLNLVIFMTPHVIHDPADMSRISVKKNNERRKFNKKQGIPEHQALYDYDLDEGLDMAPREESRTKREKRQRKRFDYNRPSSNRSNSYETEKELATRRRRSYPKGESGYANFEEPYDNYAERPLPRREKPSKESGNPFSDVRPPSSE